MYFAVTAGWHCAGEAGPAPWRPAAPRLLAMRFASEKGPPSLDWT